ncbi:MAG TPA: hypothetical protein VFI76_03075, partial [Terrimicrobiaceae bacterium]|nr:hypothetical protein [Terrimicrobiaceae bacterium]
MNVLVGIHFHTDSQRLAATIDSVHASTRIGHELLLLPDGPDETARRTLGEFPGISQSGTNEPRGAPACFNRLTSARVADIFVLLESGSLVSPGWLEALLTALDADPRNGLTGPSTNLS